MFGRWRKRGERDRANDQHVQDPQYLHAGPDQLVASEDVAMSGPGGAPADDSTPDERRERDRGD